jgi:hypothetical protein
VLRREQQQQSSGNFNVAAAADRVDLQNKVVGSWRQAAAAAVQRLQAAAAVQRLQAATAAAGCSSLSITLQGHSLTSCITLVAACQRVEACGYCKLQHPGWLTCHDMPRYAMLCCAVQVKQEWEVHSSLHHPNIIQAYLGMEDSSGVRLFMEYAGDSDAYSYINAKQRLCLREDDARQLVFDVLTALQYMHSQVRGTAQRVCGGGCKERPCYHHMQAEAKQGAVVTWQGSGRSRVAPRVE